MHVAEKLSLRENRFSRATDDKVSINVVALRLFHIAIATEDIV
jgi:hypothetical protein